MTEHIFYSGTHEILTKTHKNIKQAHGGIKQEIDKKNKKGGFRINLFYFEIAKSNNF